MSSPTPPATYSEVLIEPDNGHMARECIVNSSGANSVEPSPVEVRIRTVQDILSEMDAVLEEWNHVNRWRMSLTQKMNTQEEFEVFLDELQAAVCKEYPRVTMQSTRAIKLGSHEIWFRMFLVKMNDQEKQTQIQVVPPQHLCTKKFDTLFHREEFSYLETIYSPPSAGYGALEMYKFYYLSLISFHPKMNESGHSYVVDIRGMPLKYTIETLNQFNDELINVRRTIKDSGVVFESSHVSIEFVTSVSPKYDNQFLE